MLEEVWWVHLPWKVKEDTWGNQVLLPLCSAHGIWIIVKRFRTRRKLRADFILGRVLVNKNLCESSPLWEPEPVLGYRCHLQYEGHTGSINPLGHQPKIFLFSKLPEKWRGHGCWGSHRKKKKNPSWRRWLTCLQLQGSGVAWQCGGWTL